MNRVEALRGWLLRPLIPVEDATYEELFSSSYPNGEAYPEMIGRLKPVVRAMAYCDNPSRAEDLTNQIFLEFVQQFPGSPPEEGLLRLAQVIKKVIGTEAFRAGNQPLFFYTQLALFHVTEPPLRRCLQELFGRGLNRLNDESLTEELAKVLGMSAKNVEKTCLEAWAELERVMRDKKPYDTNGWRDLSEGYLPWQPPTEEQP